MPDNDEDPEMDARIAELKRVRVLPIDQFVAHLQGLIAANSNAQAQIHFYDQLLIHLHESNRDGPRLKAIVTLILERISNPFRLVRGLEFLVSGNQSTEAQELRDLVTAWANRKMYAALMDEPKLVPVTDPETGLTSIQPAGAEDSLLRKLK